MGCRWVEWEGEGLRDAVDVVVKNVGWCWGELWVDVRVGRGYGEVDDCVGNDRRRLREGKEVRL